MLSFGAMILIALWFAFRNEDEKIIEGHPNTAVYVNDPVGEQRQTSSKLWLRKNGFTIAVVILVVGLLLEWLIAVALLIRNVQQYNQQHHGRIEIILLIEGVITFVVWCGVVFREYPTPVKPQT
jgi:hypothetical protein